MGIGENERHTAFVIDTPEGIELYRLLVLRGRLRLELQGFRFRIPTMRGVNKTLGTNFRSKKLALDALEQHIAGLTQPITEDPL
jgi:hypothetical protein